MKEHTGITIIQPNHNLFNIQTQYNAKLGAYNSRKHYHTGNVARQKTDNRLETNRKPIKLNYHKTFLFIDR